MKYPTIEQVEAADRTQLARWYRFLPSPATRAIGKPMKEFDKVLAEEKEILDRIIVRFDEVGGMNPQISKQIGWE